jgi:hypothetical protein
MSGEFRGGNTHETILSGKGGQDHGIAERSPRDLDGTSREADEGCLGIGFNIDFL